MITMILLFVLSCAVGFGLWMCGKISETAVAGFALFGAIAFIVMPCLCQKVPITYNKIPYVQCINTEIYYSQSENKYYNNGNYDTH